LADVCPKRWEIKSPEQQIKENLFNLSVGANVPVPEPMTAYVLVVIFVATLIRSTFGFGEALIAVAAK
jgi:hypothetical protein